MYTVLVVVLVLVAVSLIGLILLQHGKGADAGAAFGSGASGTVFGSRGSANFLSRSTAVLAGMFFIVSLSLAYIVHGQKQATSVIERVGEPPAAEQPATPAAPAESEPKKDEAPVVPE